VWYLTIEKNRPTDKVCYRVRRSEGVPREVRNVQSAKRDYVQSDVDSGIARAGAPPSVAAPVGSSVSSLACMPRFDARIGAPCWRFVVPTEVSEPTLPKSRTYLDR